MSTQEHQVTPAPLVIPGYRPIEPRSITVASVHFMPCLQVRFWHSNRQAFWLPPAIKDKTGEDIRYIKVYDSQQQIPNTSDPQIPQNVAGFLPGPVMAEQIVSDLEENWGWIRTTRSGMYRVGVGRIKGETATQEELAKLMRLEKTACQALVAEADRFHAKGEGEIRDVHRGALTFLGSEMREWFRAVELGHTKKSVVSGKRIPMDALSDGGQDIVEYYAKYGLNPLDYEDRFVAGKPELLKVARKRLGMDEPPAAPVKPPVKAS